jgi:hypothetical protein
LLSLFVAWQQVQLLNAQNQKIEVQNILAEAQRRSGLMFETSAIFQQIEEEKKAIAKEKKKVVCNSKVVDQCWTAAGKTSLFVPSNATVGRLAALTQALRPYRYLSVEDQGPYRFRGDEKSKDICPEAINTELLDYAATIVRGASIGADGKPDPSPTNIDAIRNSMRKRATELGITSSLDGWIRRVAGTIARTFSGISSATLPESDIGISAISCRASSPERGQLLIALHGASVDMSNLASKGADFRFADLPGAQLKGIALRGVDLSNSRLPGASFDEAVLERVNFSGAHLAGARFSRAKLDRVNFAGAIIQAGGAQATNASLLFSRLHDSSLVGIRLVELGAAAPFFTRWCVARRLATRLATQEVLPNAGNPAPGSNPISLDGFALLSETRKYSDGSPDVMLAVVVPSEMTKKEQFLSESFGGTRVVMASRPEELHPRPLTERCVNLSIHTAPIKQTHRPCLSANARRDTASSRKAVRETCSPVSCGPSAVCTSSSPKPPTFC